MEICIKSSQGELRLNSEKAIEDFINRDPEQASHIMNQMNSEDSEFDLLYPPKGFQYAPNASLMDFNFAINRDLEGAEGLQYITLENVELPKSPDGSPRKGALIERDGLTIIALSRNRTDEGMETVHKHELAHYQYDLVVKNNPEVADKIYHLVEGIKDKKGSNSKLDSLLNRLGGDVSATELVAIVFSEDDIYKTLKLDSNLKYQLVELESALRHDTRNNHETTENNDVKVIPINRDEEPPFFTPDIDSLNPDSLEALGINDEETLNDKTNKVWSNYSRARNFKGYEVIEENGKTFLQVKDIEMKDGFLDVAYGERLSKFKSSFYEKLTTNMVSLTNQQAFKNPEWQDSIETEGLETNDLALISVPVYKKGKQLFDENNNPLLRNKFFPVLYNFRNEGKIMVATDFKYKKDTRTHKKGERVRLTFSYSDVIGIRKYVGNPKDLVEMESSLNTQVTKSEVKMADGFKEYSPETHIELNLSNTITNRKKHADTVSNLVKAGDVVRIRFKLDDKYKKQGYRDYYVKHHKVLAVHGNAVTVSINSEGSAGKTLVIPFRQIDRVAKSKDPNSKFIQNYGAELKSVELTGKALENYQTKGGTGDSVLNPKEEGNFVPFRELVKKEMGEEATPEALRAAMRKVTESTLPGDWIKFRNREGNRSYWGKIISVGEVGVSVISAETKNGDIYTQTVPLNRIDWLYNSTEEDKKVIENNKKYLQALVNEGIATQKQIGALEKNPSFVEKFYDTVTISDYAGNLPDTHAIASSLIARLNKGDRVTQRYVNRKGKTSTSIVTITRKDALGNLYYARTVGNKTYRFKLDPTQIVKFHFVGDPKLHPNGNPEGESYFEKVKERIKEMKDLKKGQRRRGSSRFNKESKEFIPSIHGVAIGKPPARSDFKQGEEGEAAFNSALNKSEQAFLSFKDLASNENFAFDYKIIDGVAYKRWKKSKDFVTKLENGYERVDKKHIVSMSEAIKRLRRGDYIEIPKIGQTSKFLDKVPVEDVSRYLKDGKRYYRIKSYGLSKNNKLFDIDISVAVDEKGDLKATYEMKVGDEYKKTTASVTALGLQGFSRFKNDFVKVEKKGQPSIYVAKEKQTSSDGKVSYTTRYRSSRGEVTRASTKSMLNKVANRLSELDGINASVLDSDSFISEMKKRGIYYPGAENIEKAFVSNDGKILINSDLANVSDAFHEYYHLIIRPFQQSRPDAYANLMEEAKQHPLFAKKREVYGESYSDQDIAEEVFVALAQQGFEKRQNRSFFQKAKDAILEFFNSMKNTIGQIFGTTPHRFSPNERLFNMSLEELADTFGNRSIRQLESIRVSLKNSMVDGEVASIAQELRSKKIEGDTPGLLKSDGLRSKLFDRILKKADSYQDALNIYATTKTERFKQHIAKKEKFQIQDGEIPFSLIDKYFGNRKIRSSKVSSGKFAIDQMKEALTEAEKVDLEESDHTYKTKSGKVIKGATEALLENDIVTPYNEDELKTAQKAQTLERYNNAGAVLAPQDQKQIEEGIDAFVENLSLVQEPGTDFHKAIQVYFDTYGEEVNKKNTKRHKDALQNAYNSLVRSRWFNDNPKQEKLFRKTLQGIINTIKQSSGGENADLRVLSEKRLVYKNEEGETTTAGTGDIVVLRSDGQMDIYDFKTSYKMFDNWNKYKNEHIVAQQLTYRNFAKSMGLNVRKSFIIPVLLDIDFQTKEIKSYEQNRLEDVNNLIENYEFQKIEADVNALYPVKLEKHNPVFESNNEISEFLKLYTDFEVSTETVETVETEKEDVKNTSRYRSFVIDQIERQLRERNFIITNRFGDKKPITFKQDVQAIMKKKKYKEYSQLNATDLYDTYADKLVDYYISFRKSFENNYSNVTAWIQTQQVNALNGQEVSNNVIVGKTENYNNRLAYLLENYIYDGNWEVYESKQLEELNIIGLRNTRSNTWQFISLTDENLDDYFKNSDESKAQRIASGRSEGTILGKYAKSRQFADEDLLKSQYGNYEAMKLALFIINNPSLFKEAKLGIKNLLVSTNFTSNDSESQISNMRAVDLKDTVEQLKKLVNSKYTKGVEHSLDNKIRDFEARFVEKQNTYLDEAHFYIDQLFSGMLDLSLNQRALEVKALRNQRVRGMGVKEFFTKEIASVADEMEKLDYQNKTQLVIKIEELIEQLEKEKSSGQKLTQSEASQSELISLLRSARLQLEGMLPGFRNESKALGYIFDNNTTLTSSGDLTQPVEVAMQKLMSDGLNRVQTKMYNFARNEFRDALNVLYKEKNIGSVTASFEHAFSGNYVTSFENMWERAPNGVPTMYFRDPDEKPGDYDYKAVEQTPLTEGEKHVMRFVIKTINEARLSFMTPSQREIFDADPRNKRMMPLQNPDSSTLNYYKNPLVSMKDWIEKMTNPGDILKGDNDFDEVQKERRYMSNRFDYYDSLKNSDQRQTLVQKSIDEGNVAAFETNVELLVNSYMAAHYTKESFNQQLKTINALRSHLLYQKLNFNIDTSAAVSHIDTYLDSALYSKRMSLGITGSAAEKQIAKEGELAVKLMTAGASIANLSVNLVSGATQMLQGTYQLAIQLAANYADPKRRPTLKHFTEAFVLVFGNIKSTWNNVTKVSELNKLYALNDDIMRDTKYLTDQDYGWVNVGQKTLMFLNSAPDYMVRMVLLIARMKKEGSWEAHQLEGDKLRYYPHKDQRFSKIFNSKGELLPQSALTTDEQLQQKALYENLLNNLDKEGGLTKQGKPFKAYDTRDRESLKNEGDTLMGAYDKMQRAKAKNNAFFSLFLQFRTPLLAFKKLHWYNGHGKVQQTQGIWAAEPEMIYNEETKQMEYKVDENGNKIYKSQWANDYYEGIFNSFIYLLSQLDVTNPLSSYRNMVKNWDNLPDNVKRIRIGNLRKFFAEITIFLMMHLFAANIGKNSPGGRILVNSVEQLNALGAGFGALDMSNPIPSLSYAHNVVSNVFDTITLVGNGEFEDGAYKLAKTFSMTRNITSASEFIAEAAKDD